MEEIIHLLQLSKDSISRSEKEKYKQQAQNKINDNQEFLKMYQSNRKMFLNTIGGTGYIDIKYIKNMYVSFCILSLSNATLKEMYDDFTVEVDLGTWHRVPCKCNECFRKDRKARYRRYLKSS
jgi:hypothetical protein